MKLIFVFFAAVGICFDAAVSEAVDVFPPGFQIESRYAVSSGHSAVSDTFFIWRTLINHEAFSLSGLYFSDNLPPEFALAGQSLLVNGTPVPFLTVGPTAGHVSTDHDTYTWIVDSRGEHEGYDYVVDPGDIVELELKLVCNEPGHYLLPTHATVFSGSDVGFFSTGQAIGITIGQPVAAPEGADHPCRSVALSATAYPNPFNPQIAIDYAGTGVAGGRLDFTVFDLSGKIIWRSSLIAETDAGSLHWRPDDRVSSGVYLYSITHENRSAGGKLILLK
jgi:hypothetical protein